MNIIWAMTESELDVLVYVTFKIDFKQERKARRAKEGEGG